MAALFLACLGATLIYAGYRLFCDLPALRERTTRRYVMLTNVLPGVTLALLGATLLTTQTMSMAAHRPAKPRHPSAQGTSWKPASVKPTPVRSDTLNG